MSAPLSLQLGPADAPAAAIEALLDRAFGPDRHGRTAYRLREGAAPIAALSFAAHDDVGLAGTLQSWPVVLAGPAGREPMILIGPVAVDPRLQDRGVGRALMRRLVDAAGAGAHPHADALLMIGDPAYYGRFGFTAEETGGWRMPGPWEPHRLLARLSGRRGRGLTGLLERG